MVLNTLITGVEPKLSLNLSFDSTDILIATTNNNFPQQIKDTYIQKIFLDFRKIAHVKAKIQQQFFKQLSRDFLTVTKQPKNIILSDNNNYPLDR